MQTKIQQIKQYTEQQIITFQRAECPVIASAFKNIMEAITALEHLSKTHPLVPQTIQMYNNALSDINTACRRLTAYGEDFTDRTGQYRKFTSEIDLLITQAIYKKHRPNGRCFYYIPTSTKK